MGPEEMASSCARFSLSLGRVGLDFRGDFFTERMGRHWNWLPTREVVVEKHSGDPEQNPLVLEVSQSWVLVWTQKPKFP